MTENKEQRVVCVHAITDSHYRVHEYAYYHEPCYLGRSEVMRDA